jgi:hypothetical protein
VAFLPAPGGSGSGLSEWEKKLLESAVTQQGFQPTPVGAPPTTPPVGAAAPVTNTPFRSINIPGYDPDYAALLKSDPTLMQGQADLEGYSGQLETGLSAAIRRAIVQAGLTGGITNKYIDEATKAAAAQNQFSGAAELEREKNMRSTDLNAILAARGILSSGALTGGTQRIQQNYERGTSQLLNSLMEAISGYEGDTATKKADILRQLAMLRESAASRLQADPRYQPTGSEQATLDPATGLYRTADGRWYDQSGRRVPAPQQSAYVAPPPPPDVIGAPTATYSPTPGTIGYKKPILMY